MSIKLIPPTTAAVTTEGTIIDGDLVGATIVVIGLGSGEEIGIEINNGYGWEQVRVGTSDFKITYETAHTKVIASRCLIRFVKPITSSACSLSLSVKDNV